MGDDFPVTVSAGSFRADPERGWLIQHAWTEAGVVVEAAPNGAAVLHVAIALCVLNDVYREGDALGLPVNGVRVRARGEFDETTWISTGITYAAEVDSTSSADDVATLVSRVDEVAEIPRALRAGTTVERVDG